MSELVESYKHGIIYNTVLEHFNKWHFALIFNVFDIYDYMGIQMDYETDPIRANLMYREFYDFQVYFHSQLCRSPKSPCDKNLNSVPVDDYVYWITLNPKTEISEGTLRGFVENLVLYNPRIFGCYEKGFENGKFHAHLIIQQSTKIDTSKTPYCKYTKTMGLIKNKLNMWRLNNWNACLIKLRYMLKDTKDNEGFFGDFHYFNDIILYKLDQSIINFERQKELGLIKEN